MKVNTVTVAEAARLLHKSRQAIQDLISAGRISTVGSSVPIRILKVSISKVKFGRACPKSMLSIPEVARHFGLTESAIRHRIRTGSLIPERRVSGKWYFKPEYIAGITLNQPGRPRRK